MGRLNVTVTDHQGPGAISVLPGANPARPCRTLLRIRLPA
jgi:hypothetical protein